MESSEEICLVFIFHSIEAAVATFAQARPPGIYKGDYLKELFRRYGDVEEAPPPPLLPDWCFEDDEDEDEEEDGKKESEPGSSASFGKRRKERLKLVMFKSIIVVFTFFFYKFIKIYASGMLTMFCLARFLRLFQSGYLFIYFWILNIFQSSPIIFIIKSKLSITHKTSSVLVLPIQPPFP